MLNSKATSTPIELGRVAHIESFVLDSYGRLHYNRKATQFIILMATRASFEEQRSWNFAKLIRIHSDLPWL